VLGLTQNGDMLSISLFSNFLAGKFSETMENSIVLLNSPAESWKKGDLVVCMSL
jgi:hypothetical protein